MTESLPSSQPDLRDLLGPLWRRKWLILIAVLLATGATYFYSSQRQKLYRTSTQVLVATSETDAVLTGGARFVSDRDTQDQAQILLSRPVAEAVVRKLQLKVAPEAVAAGVLANPVQGSNVVTVTATSASRDEAAELANAFVEEYIAYRARQLTEDIESSIDGLREELSQLPRSGSGALERQDLLYTIRRLQAARAAAPTQARQINRAARPGQPFTPRPRRDALFAFVISLVGSVFLAFGLERFDRRIKRPELVSQLYGAPLLAILPHSGHPAVGDGDHASVHDSLKEPFRTLRTNLQLASVDRPLKRLLITSAVPGEGKSTTVANLALTYREWGSRVIVVEADLRRPSLARIFGVDGDQPGLTAVLSGEVSLKDAVVEIRTQTADVEFLDKVQATQAGAPSPRPALAGPPQMALLPSGLTPPNPAALLASTKALQLIDFLEQHFDIVLIDSPPLLAVSDALQFASHCDGIVLVSRMGVTPRPAAARLMEEIRRVPDSNVLGVVANDLEQDFGDDYSYGYGLGPRYGSKPSTTA